MPEGLCRRFERGGTASRKIVQDGTCDMTLTPLPLKRRKASKMAKKSTETAVKLSAVKNIKSGEEICACFSHQENKTKIREDTRI
jgi:hypothetical protein